MGRKLKEQWNGFWIAGCTHWTKKSNLKAETSTFNISRANDCFNDCTHWNTGVTIFSALLLHKIVQKRPKHQQIQYLLNRWLICFCYDDIFVIKTYEKWKDKWLEFDEQLPELDWMKQYYPSSLIDDVKDRFSNSKWIYIVTRIQFFSTFLISRYITC